MRSAARPRRWPRPRNSPRAGLRPSLGTRCARLASMASGMGRSGGSFSARGAMRCSGSAPGRLILSRGARSTLPEGRSRFSTVIGRSPAASGCGLPQQCQQPLRHGVTGLARMRGDHQLLTHHRHQELDGHRGNARDRPRIAGRARAPGGDRSSAACRATPPGAASSPGGGRRSDRSPPPGPVPGSCRYACCDDRLLLRAETTPQRQRPVNRPSTTRPAPARRRPCCGSARSA